ncbi:MAG TPA: hypothetical protein VLR26_03170 [Frankiaceae bacterium]|nr:hypothetical protein [Frankiaceae bacterium]
MSETWDDYYSSDPTATADTSVTETPVVDTAVTSDLDSAAVADDWSSWNAESSQEWSGYAETSFDAGTTALEQGDTEGAAYEFNIASNESSVADNYGATGDDYAATADSYTAEAASTAELDSYDGS